MEWAKTVNICEKDLGIWHHLFSCTTTRSNNRWLDISTIHIRLVFFFFKFCCYFPTTESWVCFIQGIYVISALYQQNVQPTSYGGINKRKQNIYTLSPLLFFLFLVSVQLTNWWGTPKSHTIHSSFPIAKFCSSALSQKILAGHHALAPCDWSVPSLALATEEQFREVKYYQMANQIF
jgi:hypothetical protein